MLVYYQVRVKSYMFLFEIIYFASSILTKLAMAIMILRLSSTKRYEYIIWGNIALLSVNALVCLIIMFASCSPIPALWNEKMYVGYSSTMKPYLANSWMKWLLSSQKRLDHYQLCRLRCFGHGGLDLRNYPVLHAATSSNANAKEGFSTDNSQLGYHW